MKNRVTKSNFINISFANCFVYFTKLNNYYFCFKRYEANLKAEQKAIEEKKFVCPELSCKEIPPFPSKLALISHEARRHGINSNM